MKKVIFGIALLIFLAACASSAVSTEKKTAAVSTEKTTMKKFHDFKVTDIDGKEFAFSSLKGKKVMVVNTASECGLTKQYEQLEKVFKEHGGAKFTIIGFPANNFGAQEPGSDVEIKTFCSKNYGVTFPMMSKVSVKGDDIHEVYKWLTQKAQNGVEDCEMIWNFQKFLIDENGNFVRNVHPKVLPDDDSIIKWIKG